MKKELNHINQQPTCKKGGPMPETEKEFWYKIEDSLYDEKEEERKEKYKQLEFDFDYNLTEDQVAPI